MLINKVWQPLPGTLHAEIFPYLRKPDLLSSNSCIIRTPEQIVLVDAGALASQTDGLCRVVKECLREKARAVLIYLTHGHVDHALQVPHYRHNLGKTPVWIAIQEKGAEYLLQGDPGKTIAELYGIDCPSIGADIRLLTAGDKEGNTRRVDLLPGLTLVLQTETLRTASEEAVLSQKVSIGGGEFLEFYPMPGHSPDSVCIRIGEMLFIGDLLAAANPMVAGISGWNRDEYVRSLGLVLRLIESLPIRFCCPGHGGIIPADKIRDILQRLERKAGRLGNIDSMNAGRLFQITEYALELIEEAEEVFSSIAGRLLYVAYHLEQLEETAAADRCREAMQMDQIDACLLDFRTLCFSLKSGEIRRVEFAHRALNLVERMKALFDPGPLGTILPQSLINRGTGLLLDFIGIAHGFRNLEEFLPTDLNALIEEAKHQWLSSPCSDESLIDYADDSEKFLTGLVARIGSEPVADRPALDFSPAEGLPLVRVAAARLADTLLNFLEWAGRDDPECIKIATGMAGETPFITIRPQSRTGVPAEYREEKKSNSFKRRFRMCGLMLDQEKGGFRLSYTEQSEGADG